MFHDYYHLVDKTGNNQKKVELFNKAEQLRMDITKRMFNILVDEEVYDADKEVEEKDDERKKDIDKMKKFIENNPYPNYGVIEKRIRTQLEKEKLDVDNGDPTYYMTILSEYEQSKYEMMKEIHNNILDKEIVRKNGEKLNEQMGGTMVMCSIFDAFLFSIQILLDKNKDMKRDDKVFISYNFKDLLSSYWNGVGDWKH